MLHKLCVHMKLLRMASVCSVTSSHMRNGEILGIQSTYTSPVEAAFTALQE